MRPAEKLVMIGGIKGMVFSINNPEIPLRSWYIEEKELMGDASHIAKAVKEHNIGIEEVVRMLAETYEKVSEVEKRSKLYCRYSNIASRFATIIHQAIREVKQSGLLSRE